MEYLLIKPDGSISVYHSLRRLCVENGFDPRQVDRKDLPKKTPYGKIMAVMPDTRI
jgi:hypothetical protein